MTVHLRSEEGDPSLAEVTRYSLGMPHLCPTGLSENWLWKELGHRHWNLIARTFGRAAAGFDPTSAEPTYAAFRHIALRGGDLGAVRENDELDLRSILTQVSATRVRSRHFVGHGDRPIADVEMTSVFVRRLTGGVNRSVVRVRMGGSDETAPAGPRAGPERARGASPARGAPPASDPQGDERDIGTAVIEPCPELDFNGAGLLYFSSFVAAVDRAEWRLSGKARSPSGIVRRDAVFHANIEIGDDLVVRLLAPAAAQGRHRAVIHSRSDGKLLAEVVTGRAG